MRKSLTRLAAAASLAIVSNAGCAPADPADETPLTSAQLAETEAEVRAAVAESQGAYESQDCSAMDWEAFPIGREGPYVHFSAEDQVFRLDGRDRISAHCERLTGSRTAAREIVQEQTVHVLTPDVAYVITRSTAITERQGGVTEIRPTVETAIASRQGGRWRVVYKHLSWRDDWNAGR